MKVCIEMYVNAYKRDICMYIYNVYITIVMYTLYCIQIYIQIQYIRVLCIYTPIT